MSRSSPPRTPVSRTPVVMDTNVAIVANGKTEQAGQNCVRASINALETIKTAQRILLDQNGFILEEYRSHLSPSGQPGPGDAFFKWLWNNQANDEVCRQVPLTPIVDSEQIFAEFPADPDLSRFDRSDRKFVAVALGSGEEVPILNAVDTDWWNFREALARCRIVIQFICPEQMTPHR